MTDEQVKPLPAPAPAASPATPAKKAHRMSTSARLLLAIALLIAIAGAAGAGFLLYWSELKRVESLQEITLLKSSINDQAAQITQLRNEQQQTSSYVQQDRSALQKASVSREELNTRMAALEKQIAIVTGSHRIDWMLKEIEHFIMLAERRVSLLGDAKGALALLQEADNIARDLNEPAARSLRDALTKDMHALQIASEASLDIDGIFLRISNLVQRVPKLNIPRYELYQTPPGAEAGVAASSEGIELFFDRFVNFLTSLVRYQKHDKQKPVLLTAERDYMAQGIVLLLEQGQLALLRGDTNAYRLSLSEARNRIDSFLLVQQDEAKLFITELDALAAIKLRPPMPTVDGSVRAVQVFREFWSKEKPAREQALLKLELQQAADKAKAGAQQ
ncbi:MAG: uroporphyrinogen-III C-methyltransferase [Gammaproteobacteria bacterium]